MELIYGLIKIFDKEEYAKEFQNGKLFMQQLHRYRKIEDSADSNRKDILEGVTAQYNPEDFIIRIESSLGNIELGADDLAEPVRVFTTEQDVRHIFCMYSLNSKGWKEIKDDDLEVFYNDMIISNKICNLGGYAVVILNVSEFFTRVDKIAKKMNIEYSRGLVKYKDMNTVSGNISRDLIGFIKDECYTHQNEYRFKFLINPQLETYKLDIGNISDISVMLRTDELAKSISFNFDNDL